MYLFKSVVHKEIDPYRYLLNKSSINVNIYTCQPHIFAHFFQSNCNGHLALHMLDAWIKMLIMI